MVLQAFMMPAFQVSLADCIEEVLTPDVAMGWTGLDATYSV